MPAAVEGVSGQQHAPAALYTQESPGIHCTGGWVGPRVGLDGRKISSVNNMGYYNVPSYNKYWHEDGLMKPIHEVKTM